MKPKIRFFNWKKAKTLLEALLLVALVFGLLIGVFFWRVSTKPLDMAFAKPYVERALANPQRGITTKMDSLMLHWPELGGSLLLDIHGARIYGPDKNLIVEIDEASLTLSKAGLLIGRILPIGLVLKNPELTLIRTKEGKIDIGFGDTVRKKEVEEQTDLTGRILEYIARPGAQTGSPLATLKMLEIRNAQVNVEDQKAGVSSFLPQVDVVFQSTDEGLDSDLYVNFDDLPEWPSHLRASFVIPWEKRDVVVDASLENFDVTFLADKIPALSILDGQSIEVDGRLYAVLDKNFVPQQAQLMAVSSGGSLMIPEFSAERVGYKDFSFELLYNVDANALALRNTRVTLKGVTVNAEASFEVTDTQLKGPLKFSIAEMKQSQIKPLWPKALEGDNAEEWIVERLGDGTFHDVYAIVDLFAVRGQEVWEYGARDAQAAFKFENMSVDYRSPLTKVTKAKGKGAFKLAEEKLDVAIDEAMIADIKVTEAQLEFVNIIEKGKGRADLRVKVEGPLKTGLEYLTLEPIHLKHDFDLTKVKGNTKATININFPAHKDLRVADVKVNAEGVMSDVTLPGVMKNLVLTGGPLDFTVKDNQFRLAGEAKIEGQAAKIDYREFLNSEGQDYKSKVTATLVVDEKMRGLMGMDLSEFLTGDVLVDAVYTEYKGGKAEADLNVDLKPALLFFTPFGYEKKPGVAGSAVFKAGLQDGNLKSIAGLKATAPELDIKNAKFTFDEKNKETRLSSGEVPNFAVGETAANLDFKVDATGRYIININGSFFDLRPSLASEDAEVYEEPAMRISIKADRIRASDMETIRQGNLFVDIDAEGHFNTLTLSGVAGKGDVSINYKPDDSGKRVFRMEAGDAGATLRAFGVYENIIGGKLDIYGEPIKDINDRNVKGLGQITNFKVVKAPTLTRLLGLLSLPGVLSMLKDEGLTFTKLEADFNWRYSPKGSVLVVKDGRTSGNSVGFTFDGTYDKAASKIDVNGTMIPLSGMNKVIGSIPLVGDILTGGTGGVFAATYSVKGDAKNPQVFVNPLSVLTPGILRRILFEQN